MARQAWQSLEQIASRAGVNAYNANSGKGAYLRIGPYKWRDSVWNDASLAFYCTTLYYGRGADRYNEAVAALAGL